MLVLSIISVQNFHQDTGGLGDKHSPRCVTNAKKKYYSKNLSCVYAVFIRVVQDCCLFVLGTISMKMFIGFPFQITTKPCGRVMVSYKCHHV